MLGPKYSITRWVKGQMQSRRSSGFVRSSFFPIFCCSLSFSVVCVLLFDINDMSWWFILQVLEHLVNFIVPLFQSTSGLCFTNQSYSKNMSMPFRSVTAASIRSLCPLIYTSSSTNLVTSLFFVPSALKTLKDLSIGSVLILSSLTNCSSISTWVHPESTNACSHNPFPFLVLMLVCTFNSLSLLFLWFGIIYRFQDLLCTKVYHIVPTSNL